MMHVCSWSRGHVPSIVVNSVVYSGEYYARIEFYKLSEVVPRVICAYQYCFDGLAIHPDLSEHY